MKQILKDYWMIFAVLGVLIVLGIWVCTRPQSPPLLSPKAEDAVKAAITKNQSQVGADTTRSKRAAANATPTYEAGRAYDVLATILHQQSKPHANSTASSDTAAVRLQRRLAN